MEMNFEQEPEEFGAVNAWRLLHRSIVEGERVSVRCLGVQGKGVLVQTGRQFMTDMKEWSQPDYDPVQMVEGVLIMEYMRVMPSQVTDGEGVPISVTRQIVGRELVSVEMAEKKFKSEDSDGSFDHLVIIPGVVLTVEAAPQPPLQVSAQAEA